MRARYRMRVIQGNNVNHSVPVTVVASSDAEARRKALQLTDVHAPRVRVIDVEEIE